MIEASGITYQKNTKLILKNVSYVFSPKKLSLVLGPNGAGKSSFLKILSGGINDFAGNVTYDNKPVKSIAAVTLARRRAVLSQGADIHFPLAVHEVVMLGRTPWFNMKPTTADFDICAEVMSWFEISELSHRKFQTLSGGEKQRVHFARVLAQVWTATSPVLFLDEPLTYLDIHHQLSFMETLRELIRLKSLTIIGVLHDLNLAARFADELLLLDRGELLISGDARTVVTSTQLAETFRISPQIHFSDKGIYLRY